ncbi:MAG: thioredoxin family protein [Calditrichia bacterium]
MIKLTVVGPGCKNCEKVAEICQSVVQDLDIDATIEKVTDVNKFADLGIFMTPGLLVNDQVKIMGKIPAKSWVEQWVKEALGEA